MANNEVNSNYLLECPFCGGRGRIRHSSFMGRWFNEWAIECETYRTIQGYEYSRSLEEAVTLWNTRQSNDKGDLTLKSNSK